MKAAIFVALFVAVCSGASLNNPDDGSIDEGFMPIKVDLAQALRVYYESFRQVMKCGFPQLSYPVMAPFTMDTFSFNQSGNSYQVSGTYNNIEITGLDGFKFLRLDFDENTQTLSYDMIIPEIQILGEFENTEFTFKTGGFPLRFGGSGILNQKIVDLRTVGSITFGVNSQNASGLIVTDMAVNYYIGDVILNNYNNDMDVATNDFFNRMSREGIKLFLQEFQPMLTPLAQEYLVPYYDQILANTTMQGMVDFLLDLSVDFSTACQKNRV